MENVCPICNIRISDWSDATGETKVVKNVPLIICHKLCLIDFKLRHGEEYRG